MKITLNLECDSTEEYRDALHNLTKQGDKPFELTEENLIQGKLFTPKSLAIPAPLPTTFTPCTTKEKAKYNPPTVKERANISPGEPGITRMGVDMKKAMIAGVGSGAFRDYYTGKSLNYLQLMWKRGEIKFDGKDFYK